MTQHTTSSFLTFFFFLLDTVIPMITRRRFQLLLKKTRESLVNLFYFLGIQIQQHTAISCLSTTRNLKSPKCLPNRSLSEQTVKDTAEASIRLVMLFGILVKKTEFGMHFVQSRHSLVKFKFKRVWSACEMCCTRF